MEEISLNIKTDFGLTIQTLKSIKKLVSTKYKKVENK